MPQHSHTMKGVLQDTAFGVKCVWNDGILVAWMAEIKLSASRVLPLTGPRLKERKQISRKGPLTHFGLERNL